MAANQETSLPSTHPSSSAAVPAHNFSPENSDATEAQSIEALHVINGEHFSGAERVQDLLAIGLPDHRVSVSFACLKQGKFPEVRCSESPLHLVPMNGRFDSTIVRRLTSLVEETQPDLLHAHTPRSAWVASRVARRLQVPFVYHVHSPTSRDSTRRIINWVNQRVERRALEKADAIITVSHSLAKHLDSLGVPSEKVTVVPNGVATQPWTDRNLPQGPWTIGVVALFRPRKGLEILLEAVASLAATGNEVRLLAVGGFETEAYQQEILSLAKRLGISNRIEWTGFCRDVQPFWEQMDVMALPSLFGEGLPMVVLEAMAAGVPVIASAVEGVPEAIEHGTNGLICQPSDSADLAKQFLDLVRSEYNWESLRTNAWERQRERFSTQSMSAGVAQVYRKLIERE